MLNLKSLPIVAGAAVLIVGMAPVASRADLYQITSDHCSSTCITSGSLGTITVTQDGANTVKILADLSSSGSKFLNTGGTGGIDLTLAFDLNGNPLITYTNLTSGWIVGDTGTNPQSAGSHHMDGTGFWEYGVTWGTSGGNNGTAGPMSFDIAASGLTPASLQAGSGGAFFVIDVKSGQTGNTGVVDAQPSAVPAPPIGQGLPVILAIGGLLFGAKLWTRSNKRPLLPNAAA